MIFLSGKTIKKAEMLNPSEKEILRKDIISLGFHDVGFVRADKLDIEFDKYLEWLNLGYNAGMDYLKNNLEKRKDPSLVHLNAKTIVVCALSYKTPFKHTTEDFKISRYAWGEDYHFIVLPMLKKVEGKIKEFNPDATSKSYVDTGPILEKVWAVRSGIGWMGKNSLVISKNLGSYFFIGIVLTSLEIPSDFPIPDFCGRCSRCIEACPTGAIVKPKVIDSRKCISYWTIEAKPDEEIPKNIDLRNWIFGCDICQEVCPWNRKAKITDIKAFYPLKNGTNISEELLTNLDIKEFNNRFKNSPIKRSKLGGIKRNFYHILNKKEFNEIK